MLLAILIFYHGIGTLATACLPQPFAVPIREVQVYPDIADSYMIGIPAKIGSRPEQDIVLAPWPYVLPKVSLHQTHSDPLRAEN